MAAAIVNSNNVIFAKGGGEGNFPVTASFVVGGVDTSKVSAMTFQVVRPSQSTTGNTVTVCNEMGNSGQFALIPFTNDVGTLQYNSGHITVGSPLQLTSQTTSTSGCGFEGSSAYSAHYVFLNSNENEGQPMGLTLPARSESDIFYDAKLSSYDCSNDIGLRIGLKSTTSTAADFLSDGSIVFPKTDNDSYGSRSFGTVFRVKNESHSPVTVYPAVRTDWYGQFPAGSRFSIEEDSIKTRSYPL